MRFYPKKRLILYFFATCLCMVLACGGGDDGPSAEELRLQELTATWSVNSVINDGQNVTSQFNGFTLTVTSQQTYTTTNGGNAWPAQGTFELVNNNLDVFTRDDNVNISITSISETNLTLTFQITEVRGTASGTEGITGSFTFDLNKTS